MKKKRLIAFLLVFILSVNILVLPAFAWYPSSLSLTYDEIVTIFDDGFNLDITSMDYFVLNKVSPSGNDTVSMYEFYIFSPSGNEIHLDQNDSSRFSVSNSANSNFTFYTLSSPIAIWLWSDGHYTIDWRGARLTSRICSSGESFPAYYCAPRDFYMTNMPVFDGDENLNQNDYDAKIQFDSDSNSLLYQFWNHSNGKTFGVKCGIYDYADFGLDSVDDGLYWGHSVNLQPIIDWANDHNMDYLNMVAYITIYDGIDVRETITYTISQILDGAEEEDGMFDDEKEYEDFPDPSDYFDDPPDFPQLDPTPSFPGFDPEHPIDSIAEIIRWLASVIVTWFNNIKAVIRWFCDSVVYYISHGLVFLKDCFLTLVHNIGIALYNMIVKLRALFIYLVIPKSISIKDRFNQIFPIFGQFKNLFTSWGGGDQTITITLLGESATISAIDSLGSNACSVFYNLSTLMIGATSAFALFNIVCAIFGITLNNSGGDGE